MTITITSALDSSDNVDVVAINAAGLFRRFVVVAWRHDTETDGPPTPITAIGPIAGIRYAINGGGKDPYQWILFEPGKPVAFTQFGEVDMYRFLGVRP
jgi:hypothetical protein